MNNWPELPFAEWSDTLDTLHMVLQILGKVRVALSPKEPEWAHVTLYVSARGHHHRPGAVERRASRRRGRLRRTTRSWCAPPTARPSTCAAARRARSRSSGADFIAALREAGHRRRAVARAAGGRPTRSRSPTTRRTRPTTRRRPRASGSVLVVDRAGVRGVPRRVPGQGVAGAVLLGERRPRRHPLLRRAVHATARAPACSIARPTTTSR